VGLNGPYFYVREAVLLTRTNLSTLVSGAGFMNNSRWSFCP